jgi:hypothetical protein
MPRHISALLLLVGLVSGCSSERTTESVRSQGFALEGPLDIQMTHSNVAEFDGNVDIVAHIEPAGGDTRVDIHPDPTWPISNAFLGFDKFYYNANFMAHPIIRVISEGCDEPVVAGTACGWDVNQGSCVADGFGCFASLASADPSGHSGVDSPLTFIIAGDANILPNAQGARFSLHARFAEVPGTGVGCSGWFSDGQNLGAPTSDPGCVATQAPSCTLTMSPVLLALEPEVRGVQRYRWKRSARRRPWTCRSCPHRRQDFRLRSCQTRSCRPALRSYSCRRRLSCRSGPIRSPLAAPRVSQALHARPT